MKHILVLFLIICGILWMVTTPIIALNPGDIVPIQQNIQLTLLTNTPTPTITTFPPIKKLPIDIQLVITNTPTLTVTPTIGVTPTTTAVASPTLTTSRTENQITKNEATDTATKTVSSKDKILVEIMVVLVILS